MPDTVFERSIDLDAAVHAVYEFHRDTRNAPLVSPARARFLAIEGEFPVEVGSEVVLVVKQPPAPFAQRWLVRIAELETDRLVVDEAIESPFAHWRHEHRFEALGAERTRMTDRVTYRLPFGFLGRLADRLVVRRQIDRMFAERHSRTRELFARLGSVS